MIVYLHTYITTVHCSPIPPLTGCVQGSIQLQGGTAPNTGRVEVCNMNEWGTVCDDFWSNIDAEVACRQLGFPTQGSATIAYS